MCLTKIPDHWIAEQEFYQLDQANQTEIFRRSPDEFMFWFDEILLDLPSTDVILPRQDDRGILLEECECCHSPAGFLHKMSCSFSDSKGLRFTVERQS